MNKTTSRPQRPGPLALPFVFHPSFAERGAARKYAGPTAEVCDPRGFLTHEATCACVMRMHYAAWRAGQARTRREANRWRQQYFDERNRAVRGNYKLVYRAVQKWSLPGQLADDLAGDCQLVLIKAVAAFNPWLGIRFSTYAFTCLMRALSRLTQRLANDRLVQWRPLDELTFAWPGSESEAPPDARLDRLAEFFRDDDPLLTAREKIVLSRRYLPGDEPSATPTLERLGRDLGLSKERVRQVQKAALQKLREALAPAQPAGTAER